MPEVLFTRRLPDAVLAAARARFSVTVRDDTRPMSEDEAVAALNGYDAVLPTLGDAFRAPALSRVHQPPRCRLLANFGVGVNHIDVAAARAAGIAVTNTPGAVTDATADTALTLILMTARRAGEGERLVRSGRWDGWHPTQMLGMHVTGKRLGIVGMGRIGKAIARRCHFGFGMEVVFHNRSAVPDPGLPARQVSTLAEAMAQDVVVVAVPGGAATHHLIDAAVLAAMPPHGILVNISRGDVIDEAALIAALQSGHVHSAALDVFEIEPLPMDSPLRSMERCIFGSHNGSNTVDAVIRASHTAIERLSGFF
jgi:gluconate 2-dehydrogenase